MRTPDAPTWVPRRKWQVTLGLLLVAAISLRGYCRIETLLETPGRIALFQGTFLLFTGTALLGFLVRLLRSRWSYPVTTVVMCVQAFWLPVGTALFAYWLLFARKEEMPPGAEK